MHMCKGLFFCTGIAVPCTYKRGPTRTLHEAEHGVHPESLGDELLGCVVRQEDVVTPHAEPHVTTDLSSHVHSHPADREERPEQRGRACVRLDHREFDLVEIKYIISALGSVLGSVLYCFTQQTVELLFML